MLHKLLTRVALASRQCWLTASLLAMTLPQIGSLGWAEERVSMRFVLQQVEPPTFAPPPPQPPVPPPVAPMLPAQASADTAQAPTREELAAGLRPIGELTANILPPAGEMPLDTGRELLGQPEVGINDVTMRLWPTAPYAWTAPALCHRPLYFEEPSLERHGHSLCPPLQPLISGAHFLAVVPTLPYRAVAEGNRECTYTLGHFRPGSPAPPMHYGLPRRLDAAAVQGAVATGLVFLIP